MRKMFFDQAERSGPADLQRQALRYCALVVGLHFLGGVSHGETPRDIVELAVAAHDNNYGDLAFQGEYEEMFEDRGITEATETHFTTKLGAEAIVSRIPRLKRRLTFVVQGSRLKIERAGDAPLDQYGLSIADALATQLFITPRPGGDGADARAVIKYARNLGVTLQPDPRNFITQDSRKTFPEVLRGARLLLAQMVDYRGSRAAQIELQEPGGNRRVFFCSSAVNYLPVVARLQRSDGSLLSVLEIEYTKIANESPYFPARAEHRGGFTKRAVKETASADWQSRWECRLLGDVKTFQSPLPASAFQLALPPGTLVDDSVHMSQYISGADDAHQKFLPGIAIGVVVLVICVLLFVAWRSRRVRFLFSGRTF